MNLFRNKLFAASPIIALTALFIFVLTSYPAATMKPANLPIAVVNLDEGAILQDGTEMKLGEALLGQITTGAGAADRSQGGTAASPVKWVEVGSYEEMREGLDDRQYYAALVIPADFSAKQASLRSSAPESPRLEALVNQGMNATASSMVTQMMSGALATINDAVSAQLLAELEAKGATLTPSQAAVVVSPIVSSITNVNETGSSPARGNAPVSLFQPLWMASIAGAAVSTIAAGKAVEAADSR
ncbi:YhgE/Pip domain-containing protein [Paenibacillus antri]|nr:ABC transporter permease [Paenibacillus antri]